MYPLSKNPDMKRMKNSALKLVPPTNEKQTVTADMARRRPNAELRTREYLTEAEIERLLAAAKSNRWGHRDATMILVAFRHGLRVAELIDLRWDQIEFENGRLHVRRAKNGTPSVHPIHGDELRAAPAEARAGSVSPLCS
jgi:type 1 fimbriae regulatory protein FimB/type 1 fimbriae regulatory protein FimE